MSLYQFEDRRPFPTPGYQVAMLDSELLLLHPAGQTILHINETGSLVWNLCDGQRTVAEMIQLLSAAYPEASEQIAQDIPDILNQFAAQGAVTWA